MRAYSEDLRTKIVRATERGTSKAEAARLFGVSLSSVKRYARAAREGGSLAPSKGGGRPPKADETTKRILEEDVKERPAATVSDRRRVLELDGHGPQRLYRAEALEAPRLQPKKRSVGAMERDEWLRAAWRVMVAGESEAERFVFVDEMGANTALAPLYAWARKGERARSELPRNRGKNTTLLASMTSAGMGPCLAVLGGTTKAVFEAYVERVLAPALRPGRGSWLWTTCRPTRARRCAS